MAGHRHGGLRRGRGRPGPTGGAGHPRGCRTGQRGQGLLRLAGHHHRGAARGGSPLGRERAPPGPGHQCGAVQLRRESGPNRPPVRRHPALPPAAPPRRAGPSGPPGPARPAHRTAQSGPIGRPALPGGRLAGPTGHRCSPALSGSRQLQGHQRPVRSSGRRRAPGDGGPTPAGAGPIGRHRGPAGRRRVRGAGRRPRRPGGRRFLAGRAHPPGHAGAGDGGGAPATQLR